MENGESKKKPAMTEAVIKWALEREKFVLHQIEAKPSLIFIPVVVDFKKLLVTLNMVSKIEYSCKTFGNNQVKIQCTNSTA